MPEIVVLPHAELCPEGKTFDDHSLIMGSPAKATRTLDKEAVSELRQAAAHYVDNWRRFAMPVRPSVRDRRCSSSLRSCSCRVRSVWTPQW